MARNRNLEPVVSSTSEVLNAVLAPVEDANTVAKVMHSLVEQVQHLLDVAGVQEKAFGSNAVPPESLIDLCFCRAGIYSSAAMYCFEAYVKFMRRLNDLGMLFAPMTHLGASVLLSNVSRFVSEDSWPLLRKENSGNWSAIEVYRDFVMRPLETADARGIDIAEVLATNLILATVLTIGTNGKHYAAKSFTDPTWEGGCEWFSKLFEGAWAFASIDSNSGLMKEVISDIYHAVKEGGH